MTVDLDGFYHALEAQFRGSREDIKQRQSVYLPLVDYASPSESAPVLDIGCGRGEWIELMRGHGVRARGVDMNAKFVEEGIQAGFDIAASDGLTYLRNQPADAYSLLSAFHVVEHLEFSVLMELAVQAHRVLKPGGVCLFETPNPMNVRVGINNFYLDPTHIRPVPSELLKFVMEYVGFSNVTILHVNGGLGNDADLFSPPDYAVIAFRAPATNLTSALASVGTRIHSNRQAHSPPDAPVDSIKLVSAVLDTQTRVQQAEWRAQAAEQAARQHEEAAQQAQALVQQVEARAQTAEQSVQTAEQRALQLGQQNQDQDDRIISLESQVHQLADRARNAESTIESVFNSSSWRVTAPLRALSSVFRAKRLD